MRCTEIFGNSRPLQIFVLAAASLSLAIFGAAPAGQSERIRDEERIDYFQKWLNQDVVYIITEEERSVFESLTTAEERERFIEQFWQRRDPDPRSGVNEFREEHYRRIAYANERFASGVPGWTTDRGRIYIIHGPPDGIETHAGGAHRRLPTEGGGMTSVHPFQVWRYRHIEGIGNNIEIEFVDRDGANHYRLALHPDEKDALLTVPGAGLTLAEQMGLTQKHERPIFQPGYRDTFNREARTYLEDNPFIRFERFARVGAVQPIRYNDLKELVEVQIGYQQLPFRTRRDYFHLNEGEVMVPISLEVDNRELTFREEGGRHVARVAVYGIITSITNQVIAEFDDDLELGFRPEQMPQARTGRAIYQKTVPVARNQRYRLDLVVKDLNSEKAGHVRESIIPPPFQADTLFNSSLILSDSMRPSDPFAGPGMFSQGDIEVQPNLTAEFTPRRPMGTYLQLHNVRLDQATGQPDLDIRYRILQDAREVKTIADQSGESLHYISSDRVVLVRGIPVHDLAPGSYQLSVAVTDRISGQSVTVDSPFSIVERFTAAP
jgi:GWxTD domain-containing protein